MKDNKSKMCCKRGFTLIELLVVVLIIGILAAVAVPQYQKAVEKSRASEAISLLKSVYDAAQIYYLKNGTWPRVISQLDIDIPWTGSSNWRQAGEFRAGISNQDWSIQLVHRTNDAIGVSIGRISGKYRGTGFQIYLQPKHPLLPIGEVLCVERGDDSFVVQATTDINGYYCSYIFNASTPVKSNSLLFYKL